MRTKEVEEAINTLQNCIADYVIGDFCVGKYCPMEDECKDRDCPFQLAIDTTVNYISELEKDNIELRKYYATRKEVEDLKDTINCLHESSKQYINKDKIRDKIKLYELEIETLKTLYPKSYTRDDDYYLYIGRIQALENLLEGE